MWNKLAPLHLAMHCCRREGIHRERVTSAWLFSAVWQATWTSQESCNTIFQRILGGLWWDCWGRDLRRLASASTTSLYSKLICYYYFSWPLPGSGCGWSRFSRNKVAKLMLLGWFPPTWWLQKNRHGWVEVNLVQLPLRTRSKQFWK